MIWLLLAALLALASVVVYDIFQCKHAILRNFPIIGHFRYWLETIGPELRQYIVTSNNEERPFNRDQRSWIYASSKKQNNYFGFGTDNELELSSNYVIIKHAAFPLLDPHTGEPGFDAMHHIPCAKVLGAHRSRRLAFRPQSVVNLSAMSYGSLSATAVRAINRGCKIAGLLHNTGEGSVSRHHQQGGDLVWQLGTAYFGCRDERGRFDLSLFLDVVASNPVRAIEIKLSQGAKPGVGGVLPAVKITHELADIRHIPLGRDCISPSAHSAFTDVDSMLDFVEMIAEKTGLPVGVKSAVGEKAFWTSLAQQMKSGERGVDFITVDGGEGGTGAGPLVFTDHVALPFKLAFTRVHRVFAEADLHERIVFIGSGKLGFPETALFAFAAGCDMINIAREALLAVGCIQSQRCHTNHCPTGVTTNNRWLMRGLDPTLKSARLANYVVMLRKELLRLCHACGELHPSLITNEHIEILDGRFDTVTINDLFGYRDGWGLPSTQDQREIRRLMSEQSQTPSAIASA